ncbi:MAG: LysE/ArgO family amino acid transporter [Pseudonocardiales bacterium]|nr:LysE/ArgO family amino acid transporter [Pseudonocardiales bacterium]
MPLTATLSGFALGLSLIVAIGAQNAFLLRQGLAGRHVAPVAAVCVLSDAVLIVAGVAGAGVLVSRFPAAVTAVRLGGAAFLLVYAVLAARRALRPGVLVPGSAAAGPAAAVATALALTWLNPHVYLDTVVLLGGLSGTWGGARWWFAAGAVVASTVWFLVLGYGAGLLRPVFARPGAWRVLDGSIALVMGALAVGLVAGA